MHPYKSYMRRLLALTTCSHVFFFASCVCVHHPTVPYKFLRTSRFLRTRQSGIGHVLCTSQIHNAAQLFTSCAFSTNVPAILWLPAPCVLEPFLLHWTGHILCPLPLAVGIQPRGGRLRRCPRGSRRHRSRDGCSIPRACAAWAATQLQEHPCVGRN